MAALDYRPKKKLLTLTIEPEAVDLFSEVALARFNSLAASLGAEPIIKYGKKKSG